MCFKEVKVIMEIGQSKLVEKVFFFFCKQMLNYSKLEVFLKKYLTLFIIKFCLFCSFLNFLKMIKICKSFLIYFPNL